MRQTNNPASALPFHAAVPIEHGAVPESGPDAWRIHYRQGTANRVAGFQSSDAATEAACRLLDNGSEVIRIGTSPGVTTIDRERLALIYASWVRARYH